MDAMELLVDFNMEGEDGRIPALVAPPLLATLTVGTRVIAADGEGTECDATVEEVDPARGLVMVVPVNGTTRPSHLRPASGGSTRR